MERKQFFWSAHVGEATTRHHVTEHAPKVPRVRDAEVRTDEARRTSNHRSGLLRCSKRPAHVPMKRHTVTLRERDGVRRA